jgi:hypothetical protein
MGSPTHQPAFPLAGSRPIPIGLMTSVHPDELTRSDRPPYPTSPAFPATKLFYRPARCANYGRCGGGVWLASSGAVNNGDRRPTDTSRRCLWRPRCTKALGSHPVRRTHPAEAQETASLSHHGLAAEAPGSPVISKRRRELSGGLRLKSSGHGRQKKQPSIAVWQLLKRIGEVPPGEACDL